MTAADGDTIEGTAEQLAARLFGVDLGPDAHPFWADGGDAGDDRDPRYAPGRHVLAAFPTRVDRIRVDALPFRGLGDWLRARLPTPQAGRRAPLTVALLAYDAGRNLEEVPDVADEEPSLPDVVVARYDAFAEADDANGPWTLRASDPDAAARLLTALSASAPPEAAPWRAAAPPVSEMPAGYYGLAVQHLLEQIAAGDFYQVNLARRLVAPMPLAAAWPLWLAMRRRNPAAFGALFRWAPGGWLLSSSPECLLRYDAATREAHSYPIKGTRPRGETREADLAAAAELRADPKERAEHVMIVDLVRNDLGRVAVAGGVSVPALFDAMRLPTVHHLVSDVRAAVAEDRDLVDVLLALFPGGSITGAPKIAAMEAIELVERLRRGFYTGSLGLVFGDGEAVFDILIRTAVLVDDRLYYATGGGIVADSDPAREWAETEAKARALVDVLTADPR